MKISNQIWNLALNHNSIVSYTNKEYWRGMPYEPFDYFSPSTHIIRKLELHEYTPTKHLPWRQVQPHPSLTLVLIEPESKLLVKLQFAECKNQIRPFIIGSAVAFPPNYWHDFEKEVYEHQKEEERKNQSFKNQRSSTRDEESQQSSSNTYPEPRKTQDQGKA